MIVVNQFAFSVGMRTRFNLHGVLSRLSFQRGVGVVLRCALISKRQNFNP